MAITYFLICLFRISDNKKISKFLAVSLFLFPLILTFFAFSPQIYSQAGNMDLFIKNGSYPIFLVLEQFHSLITITFDDIKLFLFIYSLMFFTLLSDILSLNILAWSISSLLINFI